MDTLTAANAALWENKLQKPYGRYPSEEMIRFLARTFRERQKSEPVRILELGCGPGANLWAISREGYQVAGIDFSPTAIRRAAERMTEEGLPEADLKVGSMSSLPWPNDYFDAVIDVEGICCNTWQVAVSTVAEAERVLKPGGHVYSFLLGTKTSGRGSGRVIDDRGTETDFTAGVLQGSGITHFFSEEELRELFGNFTDMRTGFHDRKDADHGWVIFDWVVKARKKV